MSDNDNDASDVEAKSSQKKKKKIIESDTEISSDDDSDFESDSPKKKRPKKAKAAEKTTTKKTTTTTTTTKNANAATTKTSSKSNVSKSTSDVKKVTPIISSKSEPSVSLPSVKSSSSSIAQTITVPSNGPAVAASSSASSSMDITHGPEITSEAAAKKIISQYLRQQNRPYSAIQVHDNLHKRAPKSVVERVLTSLSEDKDNGGICCKEYGKAKIYYVDQSTLPSNATQAEIDAINNENTNMKLEITKRTQEEKLFKGEISRLAEEPPQDQLDMVLGETKASVGILKDKSSNITERAFDPDMMANLIKIHNCGRLLWKDRKENCIEIIDSICESSGKKTKVLTTEMGIETDEDVDRKNPAAIVLPRK